MLTGHEKGILDMAWSAQDPDLLITCGKDSRTVCWNPNQGTIVGEVSAYSLKCTVISADDVFLSWLEVQIGRSKPSSALKYRT